MSSYEGQLTGWLYGALSTATEPASAIDAVRAQAQTEAAICALVAEHSPALYRVAYSVTRNAPEAEDAVQETFLRVLKHREKLSEIRDTRVWLVRITWNVVLDKKRRSKTRPETDDIADMTRTLRATGPCAEASVVSSEGYGKILGLIDTLPSKERQALLLSAVDELSTMEIAAVLSTTESSVRSRIFRARRTLAFLLEAGKRPGSVSRTVNKAQKAAHKAAHKGVR